MADVGELTAEERIKDLDEGFGDALVADGGTPTTLDLEFCVAPTRRL